MPSYKKNRCIIISPKKGNKGNTFILIQKTGYANIWLYDRHYYWDNTTPAPNVSPVDFDRMTNDYIASQRAKKKIVVRRK